MGGGGGGGQLPLLAALLLPVGLLFSPVDLQYKSKKTYSLVRDCLRDHALITRDYREGKNEIACNIRAKSRAQTSSSLTIVARITNVLSEKHTASNWQSSFPTVLTFHSVSLSS